MHLALSLLALLIPFFSCVTAAENENGAELRQNGAPYLYVTRSLVQYVTCTRYTNINCAGRRKRGILADDDLNDEQFRVDPSGVQGVEPTTEPTLHVVTVGNTSDLNFHHSRSGVESAISGDLDRQSIPSAINYAVVDIPVNLVLFMSYVTSVPACFAPGPFMQCPRLTY